MITNVLMRIFYELRVKHARKKMLYHYYLVYGIINKSFVLKKCEGTSIPIKANKCG